MINYHQCKHSIASSKPELLDGKQTDCSSVKHGSGIMTATAGCLQTISVFEIFQIFSNVLFNHYILCLLSVSQQAGCQLVGWRLASKSCCYKLVAVLRSHKMPQILQQINNSGAVLLQKPKRWYKGMTYEGHLVLALAIVQQNATITFITEVTHLVLCCAYEMIRSHSFIFPVVVFLSFYLWSILCYMCIDFYLFLPPLLLAFGTLFS